MYVDGYLLLAIYFIAVLSLAVSTWAVWSLEEIRKHYERMYNKTTGAYTFSEPVKKTVKK
jgi:hypothetical protein